MGRSSSGELTCACKASYIQVGDARVGPQSCVLASQGQTFHNIEGRKLFS